VKRHCVWAVCLSQDCLDIYASFGLFLTLGRANVGKSTLLNALMGRTDMVRVSKKAGHTKSLNFFRLGIEPDQLVLVDSPGYGMRGRREFSGVFDEYMKHRSQLQRVFILINAQHGILDSDRMMMEHLSEIFPQRENPFTLQPVITKIDSLAAKGRLAPLILDLDATTHTTLGNAKRSLNAIRQDIAALQLSKGGNPQPAILDPILTAATTVPPFGIEQLRTSVEEACSLTRP
jgi:GTP-binding protein